MIQYEDLELLKLDWLADHLVDSALPGLEHVLLLGMTGHSDYHRLLRVLFFHQGSDLSSGAEAVENGHADVHQDEGVVASVLDYLVHFLNGFLAVGGCVDNVVNVHLLYHANEGVDVEGLVVYDQQSLLV